MAHIYHYNKYNLFGTVNVVKQPENLLERFMEPEPSLFARPFTFLDISRRNSQKSQLFYNPCPTNAHSRITCKNRVESIYPLQALFRGKRASGGSCSCGDQANHCPPGELRFRSFYLKYQNNWLIDTEYEEIE